MKKRVTIKLGNEVLFEGDPLNIPFKEEAIRQKSLDLFDDDDPCIIHQSHIARDFAKTLQKVFAASETGELRLKDHEDTLYFIDAPDDATLTMEG